MKSLPDGGERLKNDPRNRLYRRFVNYVRHFRPKCFVMENVPGMLKHDGANVAEVVKRELERCGYRVGYKVINAAEHGVPQVRRRLFFVGFRDGLQIDACDFFDSLVKHAGPSVGDAIRDLPRIGHAQRATPIKYKAKPGQPNWFVRFARARSNGKLADHITRSHNEQDLKAFAYMKQGMTYSELPKRFKRYSDETFKDKYKKLCWDRQAWTLTAHLRADCYTHIHPSQRRTISVREAARLQSFPDWFKLDGSLGGKFQLIGNAVPPLLAKQIAHAVKKRISKCRTKRRR
jgi:DNA (cytosine-5)-methyltransferase 1